MAGTTGFKIGSMRNGIVKDCVSIGMDVGFDINEMENIHFIGNVALSNESIELLQKTKQFISDNKDVIISESNEEVFAQIEKTVKALNPNSPTSVLDVIDTLTSIGANTLSIWPTIHDWLMQLATIMS